MNRFASRVALLTLPLLAALVVTAQAQVATMDLAPAAPRFIHPQALGFNTSNLVPENPAALAWGAPSRAAAAIIDGSMTDNVTPGNDSDLKGNLVGGTFVGPTFAVAAERQETRQEAAGVVGVKDVSTELGVSVQFGGVLAVGVGIGDYNRDTPFVTPPQPTSTGLSRTEYGASLRLADIYYVGVAAYKESQDSGGTTAERTATLAGLALRTKGPTQWYLAVESSDLKDFEAGGVSVGGAFKGTRLTAQVNNGGFLLGASYEKYDISTGGSGPTDAKVTTLDAGWVPMAGLSVAVRVTKAEVLDTVNVPPNTDETVDGTSVSVAWLF